MFHISKDGIKSSAFQVSTATFDGTDFTGPPFHGNVNHDWLQKAISAGVVSLLPNNKAEPAVWGVQTGPGEIVLASPGDYLVRPVGTETIHVCSGPLWELLTEPLVEGIESDEANWPEAISTLTLLFRETATRLRSGGIPDWGIFMDDLRAKIDEITNAGAIKRWGLYREDLNAKEPMVDLGSVKIQNASLSGMTLPLDDPNRQPGVIDIRDKAGNVTGHAWLGQPIQMDPVPARYAAEQPSQDEALGKIRHLRAMLDNDDVSFDTVQAYQDLSWAKYILLDKAPHDLKLISDKCLTLGLVDMLPTCGNDENEAKKAMVALSAQGILGACNLHYQMGLDRHGVDWEKVRWGMAWAKLITGDPVGGEVEDPTYKAIAKRAAEYQLNPDQNDSANILVRPGTPEELGIPNPVDGRTYGVVFEDVKPAPEEATLAEVCDHFQGEVVQKRLNDWCDRVHAAYLKVNPTTLTNWPKFLDEVHEIIGDDDPMRLPMAWLKTYGTVAAMAKSYEWLQPGEMETSSLTTAKTIGQNLVDQARRKQEE